MTNKNFNSDMLLIARQARGLSQEDAVSRIRVLSQPTYSRIEAGLRRPTAEEVDAIARGLGFRRNFFLHPFRRRPMPAIFHRKRQKLTNKDWEHIFARAEVRRVCITLMLDAVRLAPKQPLAPLVEPTQSGQEAARIAGAVRQLWMTARGPIPDVTRTLEAAGIIIVPFDFGTDLLDGFSERTYDNLPPLVFVNTRQPKDRLRFTLAHELGHIVMHQLPYPEMEGEANEFAAEFLMPLEDVKSDLYAVSLDHFLLLKGKWRVSVASLIRTARRADRLNDAEYKARMIELNRRGWKTIEPLPLPEDIERPRILEQLVGSHTKTLGYSEGELSKLFGLMPNEAESVLPPAAPEPERKLRLIVSN